VVVCELDRVSSVLLMESDKAGNKSSTQLKISHILTTVSLGIRGGIPGLQLVDAEIRSGLMPSLSAGPQSTTERTLLPEY
jgi:hypothetical protein